MSHCIRIAGRTVGVIRGDVLDLRRHRNGFLSKPPAIAVAVETVETARQAGVRTIKVLNLDTDTTYTISLSDFLKYAWKDARGGFEEQFICAQDRFETKRKAKISGIVSTKVAAPTRLQPRLF